MVLGLKMIAKLIWPALIMRRLLFIGSNYLLNGKKKR
jgi:hypothetical protein